VRIAIVVPRYGLDILGGAETLARGLAKEIARQGWVVEVWTTCARSHYTWENFHSAGTKELDGVIIHRFPITGWHSRRQAEIEARLISMGPLSIAEQYAWLENGAHSVPLYKHIKERADAVDALIVLPYAAPLAHYAAWIVPEKVVMWPCLHNEPYAYTEPVRLLLKSVRGVIFNSPEEKKLATDLLGIQPFRCAVLGAGISLYKSQSQQENGSHLLYVGRLEEGKNLALLYKYVQQCAETKYDIHLVVVGDGPLKPPIHPAFDYRGFIAEQDKFAAYTAALALCQPSLNESFSLTIMESWLAGRPVLVHGDCAVTRGHVQRSKGGLWFRTYPEFIGCIEWLQEHRALAARMGNNGCDYVYHNYTWEAIGERFKRIITAWQVNDMCFTGGPERG
jgi:glycosyltransferase involved in cell wall biosynthesis